MDNLGIVVLGKESFEEVFEQWMKFEEENSEWQNLAVERGYSSVRDWRLNAYLKPFGVSDFDGSWMNCEVEDLNLLMHNLYMGPYNGWRGYYGNERDRATFFSNLDNLSDLQGGTIAENKKVLSIKEDFPIGTVLIAVTDGVKVCLLDGHHRSAAIAMMIEKEGLNGSALDDLQVKIKLLDMSGDQAAFDKLFYFEG